MTAQQKMTSSASTTIELLDTSLYIIGLVTLVAESARGIVFPVLWPLCQKLNGSTIDYGYLVGIFSIGRVVISSRLGIISDTHGHKEALTISFSLFVLGAILWCNTAFTNSLPALYVAQFVLGLGTGVLGVVRSYVVEQVAPVRRTYILARLSALQYTGFAVTPLLGMLLLLIGRTLSTDWSYMLPGYLVLILAILCLVLIVSKLENIKKEKEYHVDKANSTTESENNKTVADRMESGMENGMESGGAEKGLELNKISNPIHTTPSPSTVAAIPDTDSPPLTPNTTSSANKSVDMHVLEPVDAVSAAAPSVPAQDAAAVVETIYNYRVYVLMLLLNFTTRGALAVYETEGAQVLLDEYDMQEWELGLLTSGAGVIGTIQLLFFKQFWTNRCSDMTLLIGGFGLFGLAQLIIINWGPGTNASLTQYCFAMYIVYGFAYPIANSASLGVFAKIQKDGKQATAQGHLASMGSLSRAIFPIVTGYLNNYIAYSSAFAVTLILMTGSLIAVILLRTEIMSVTEPTKSSDSALTLLPSLRAKLYSLCLSDKVVIFVAFVLAVCAVVSIAGGW